MAPGVIEVLAGSGILFIAIYYYLTSNFNYWQIRNIKGPKPVLLWGNFKDVFFGRINVGLFFKKYYDEFKPEPVVGIFTLRTPTLIVRDPDLIQDVLIKNFHSFQDRKLFDIDNRKDPASQNIVHLEYQRWRPLRTKLSPVFSSVKLKSMFHLMMSCANKLETYIDKLAQKGEPIECCELTAKFTTDIIGICVFGLNANALSDEESAFRKSGRDILANSFRNSLRFIILLWFPKLYGILKPIVNNGAYDYFITLIKETIEYRKKNNIKRNDFIDFLMDLKDHPEKLNDFEFTDEMLTSQALIFFVAGFESSSNAMSNVMYELALNQDIQDKLRDEIIETYKKDGEFTSENIKSMNYLAKVVKETLRKYPPATVLQRCATSTYKFSKIDLEIPIDMRVMIPVWAIHRDPEIYPEPDKFDPERFSEENEQARHPMYYLPFGDGPHNCIASRFANYQVKVGIVSLINKFRVNVCDKTCIPYKIYPRVMIPTPIGGIQLKITKL